MGNNQATSDPTGSQATAISRNTFSGAHRTTTVQAVREVMDKAYPPKLAEKWDKVGLVCGDPQAMVGKIVLALECTDSVVDAAIEAGAQMIVVHHPLLLRGVNSVAADTPKGRILHRLIKSDIALFAAHTNADSARPGVNDELARILGVTAGAPLAPQPAAELDTWTVKIPADHVDAVMEALFDAGAGQVGDYDRCSFTLDGTGQFRPGSDAEPFIGTRGDTEIVHEKRVEFTAPRTKRTSIYNALLAAHPYEEPAFDILSNEATGLKADEAVGIGRVGDLDKPMPFKDFVERVAERLPKTVWGVRGAGDPDRIIRRVAVASGAGDSFLDTVTAMNVDAFVTSDLRHHPVDEALRAGAPCIVDTAHWASEYPWCSQAAELLSGELGVPAEVLPLRTDPWTIAAK